MVNRLPRGCVNVGGELAHAMEEFRKEFISLFENWGYSPFLPSGLQLLESSWEKLPSQVRSRLVTLTTPYGEPCCLRGDITLAAVTYLASHYAPEERPLRICYCDRIYMKSAPPRTSIESFQLGAELLGWEGEGADAEMLSLLLRVLDTLGLERTTIALGDSTFLQRALVSIESATAQGLADALRKGSLPDYYSLLERGNIPDFYRTILLAIPRLRGDGTVLDEAEKLWGKGAPLSALKTTVETLKSLGYGERLSIDLSLVRDPGYYSGPLFEIYSWESGRSLGGGGRYDRLLASCGLKGQAMGFALDLEQAAGLSRFRTRVAPVMAWAGQLSPDEALRRAADLISDGTRIEMDWKNDRASSLQAAEKRGCRSWMDLASGTAFTLVPAGPFRKGGK
jgi:ATP phosphoribosyltransferase regulatory subunit